MAIDLDACTGCSACVISCQAENNVPVVGAEEIRKHRDLFWLRIDRYFAGDPDNPDVLMEPMLCQHCDHASCENVCPVLATMQSIDGLNMQVYNRCVGTRYCANNCAYKVRRFNWFKYEMGGPVERMVFNPDVVVRERGVMEKCSFCAQRIQSARIASKREGKDSFEVQTACQQSCPAGAITFGDNNRTDSELIKWKKSPRAFQVLPDVGVKPSITYLARVRNRAGEPGKGKGDHA
jgi:molybdopterin-containing oxidoreductase family iron-sulfur binding subunit